MSLTDLEKMILQQADAIRARERQATGSAMLTTPDGERDYDAEVEFYAQFGTSQQIEMVLAAKDNRPPRWEQPNPAGSFGALVPPSEVRDAATRQRLVSSTVVQPSQADLDEDPTKPVRESDPDVAPYLSWKKDDLLEEARIRELPVSNKSKVDDIVVMLRADDEEYAKMRQPQPVEGDHSAPQ